MKNKKNVLTLVMVCFLCILGILVNVSTTKSIMPEHGGYILSYTREEASIPISGRDNGMYKTYITDSMHLAYSKDGVNFEALNYNSGVLFAKREGSGNISTKVLKTPYIFRMKDGSFGVLAIRTSKGATTQDEKPGRVLFFTSKDLISYEEVGFLTLSNGDTIENPACVYNAESNKYHITWKNGNTGISYVSKTADFQTIEPKEEFTAATQPSIQSGIEFAKEVNMIPVTVEEADYILKKLTPVTNTTVDAPTLTINKGETVDLSQVKVKANYSDGSLAEKTVIWDADQMVAVTFGIPGKYEVDGIVKQISDQLDDPEKDNYPFIANGADPNVVKYNGKYYYIATTENSNNISLSIRESETIVGLGKAEQHLIYDIAKAAEGGIDSPLRHWAPELHVVNGELCLFVANNIGTGWNVNCIFMKLGEGGDPKEYDDWEAPKVYLDKNGNILKTAKGGITLDMTYFTYNNRHYVAWAQTDNDSNIWIGETTAEEPWKLISDQVKIIPCEYGWERNGDQYADVNEGPFVIITKDKLYMTYSGAATNETYSVGTASIDLSENVNFLDANAWKRGNYPTLTGFSAPGYDGPGHNSYVEDEDGNLINVFHARAGRGSGARDTFLRIVHFGFDGNPVLDMIEEREILPENKNVKMTVFVVSKDSLASEIGKAENISVAKYTEASVNVMKLALENARAVYLNADANQDAINQATTALVNAVSNLVMKPVPTSGGKNDLDQPKVTPGIKLNYSSLNLQVKKSTAAVMIKSSNPTGEKIKSAKSDKKNIADVTVKNGKMTIKGKKVGKAVITVTSTNNGVAKIKISVKKKVSTAKLTLNKKKSTIKVKRKLSLKLTKKPVTSTDKITWSSSDKKVAVVTSKGVITGKKKGKTTIMAKSSNGKKAICKLIVK